MQKRKVYKLLANVTILTFLLTFNPDIVSQARPLAAGSLSQPDGTGDIVAEGDDFASTVLRDAWDMNEESDISLYGDITNVNFSGGVFSFTAGADPSLFLLHHGYGVVQVGKTGEVYPINTSKYSLLSFRMNSDQTGKALIYWFYDHSYTNFAWSSFIDIQTGWHTYTINLNQVALGGTVGGATGWNGQVTGLRLDPVNSSPNANIQLDWVRLTAPDTSYTLPISWNGVSGSTLNFYLDDDTSGCDGPQIAAIASPATSDSFTWGNALQPSASAGQPYPLPVTMAPGDYYVCGKVDGGDTFYSSGPLSIDSAPILHITHPSYLTGPDYASNAGIPWDMNSATAFSAISNFSSYSFSEGQFHAINTNGDPALTFNTPTPIDTSKYKYFSYRMYLEGDQDIFGGWVSRIFWYDFISQFNVTKDIIIYPGWNTYTLDLRQALVEPGSQTWAAEDSWQTFRFDPNENIYGIPWTTHFDWFLLTGDPEGRVASLVSIWYDLAEPGATVTLYYDSDQDPDNGKTLLIEGSEPPHAEPTGPYYVYLPLIVKSPSTAVTPSGTKVLWDTTGVTPGTYYIMAEVTDGYNTKQWYSDVPYILQ